MAVPASPAARPPLSRVAGGPPTPRGTCRFGGVRLGALGALLGGCLSPPTTPAPPAAEPTSDVAVQVSSHGLSADGAGTTASAPQPSPDDLVEAVTGALPDGAHDDLWVECARPDDCLIVTVQPDNDQVAGVLEVLDATCAAHGDCSVWLTSISSTADGKRAEFQIDPAAR